jgi:uncharacterized repeat protein (TIGR03803 family)
MKIKKNLIHLSLLGVGLLAFQESHSAQVFSIIHNFNGNPDGAGGCRAELTLSSGVLYGTTHNGGSANNGTVFKVNADGTGYTVLKRFSAMDAISYTNDDGAIPTANVALSSNVLYGTTEQGGILGGGTLFKINTDGTGFAVLKHFDSISNWGDGFYPEGNLTLSGQTIYGLTSSGGANNQGTIFSVNTSGSNYSVLKNFAASNGVYSGVYMGITLSSNTLYGTTVGNVYKLNTNGTGFTVLRAFNFPPGNTVTNIGGYNLQCGLTLFSNMLFGTCAAGGIGGGGTVFKLNTDGTGFAVLHEFTSNSLPQSSSSYRNSDGGFPTGQLSLLGNTLYGTAYQGGTNASGTLFQVNTDGTGFNVLKTFSGGNNFTNSDGTYPLAGMTLSGSTFFGTTLTGGSAAHGVLFSFDVNAPTAGYNQLTSQALPGGKVRLGFLGNPGASYALVQSSSLTAASWTPQVTNTADGNGNIVFTNTPNAATANFWRIRSVP